MTPPRAPVHDKPARHDPRRERVVALLEAPAAGVIIYGGPIAEVRAAAKVVATLLRKRAATWSYVPGDVVDAHVVVPSTYAALPLTCRNAVHLDALRCAIAKPREVETA
jgi:hypothetical protein